MRIISGYLKGRRLDPPERLGIRPTMDRAREALFNLLFSRLDIEDAIVLDLFAGSGAVGFEALSRGAAQVTGVDKQAAVVEHLRATAERFDVSDSYRAVLAPVERYLSVEATPSNLIFLDPPYALPRKEDLIATVFQRNLILPGGLLVMEHASGERFEEHPHFSEARTYGNSTFSFFTVE